MKSDPYDKKAHFLLHEKKYRHLFLVQNRAFWHACPFQYDRKTDLVLTFDFAVVFAIRSQGGEAAYLDHWVPAETMERYNAETYHFFENWYLDREGNDIFSYRGIDIGKALRLDIWNDVTYYVRILVNLLAIRRLNYERMYVGIGDGSSLDAIARLGVEHETWICATAAGEPEYYFPIFRWMNERIRPMGVKQRLRELLSRVLDRSLAWGERLGLLPTAEIDVFVQRYYPSVKIVERLKQDAGINVMVEQYTWGRGLTREMRIPVWKPSVRHRELAEEMLKRFPEKCVLTWEIEGFCISDALYSLIARKIGEALALSMHSIDAILDFLAARNLKAMVYIANVGLVTCLVLDYCTKNGIPSYFILNGLLLHEYPEEDVKGITWINSYGEAIKKTYFKGADNVVCLGDPRMDSYVNGCSQKAINHSEPTILIGAGGFSNIDLNSYTAVEFEFLYDVMQAFRILRGRGKGFKIILKVRSNGYIDQYRNFLGEYFGDLPVTIIDDLPFSQLLITADLYISIYSGTLFEASCLGIPVLYYKIDTEILIPPYDGKSELVTAFTPDELVEKIGLFYKNDPLYEAFKDKRVMEKYIGPLDGRNLERNMDFIHSLIRRPSKSSLNH